MELKVIDYTYFNPNLAFFKNRNDREKLTVYYCSMSDQCPQYKSGHCILKENINLWATHKCPFGRKEVKYGYTPRARKFGDILKNFEKNNQCLPKDHLKVRQNRPALAELPNSLFLLDMNYLINSFDNLYEKKLNNYHIPDYKQIFERDKMTLDFFKILIDYKPRSLMSGEIVKYQEEEVPKLLSSIRKYFPKIYQGLLEEYPKLKDLQVNYMYRLAKLHSLLPGKVATHVGLNHNIKGKDIGFWDGQKLTLETEIAKYTNLKCNGKGTIQISFIPDDGAEVYIVDENTVDEDMVELV